MSSWNEAVIWTNGANATSNYYSDEAETTLGETHKVKVSGMENLLLLTGAGDDVIVQNVAGTNDEFRLGDGDDTLTLGGDSANDTVSLGSG